MRGGRPRLSRHWIPKLVAVAGAVGLSGAVSGCDWPAGKRILWPLGYLAGGV